MVLWLIIIGLIIACVIYNSNITQRAKEKQYKADKERIAYWRSRDWNMSVDPDAIYPDVYVSLLADMGHRGVGTSLEFSQGPEWFISAWVKDLKISPAEQLIIDELQKYDIMWEREVSFRDMILPTGYPARYDFYLYNHNLIIEYDSKLWHSTPEKLQTDKLKTTFCTNNNIRVIRYNSKHYYTISGHIAILMEDLRISLKSNKSNNNR